MDETQFHRKSRGDTSWIVSALAMRAGGLHIITIATFHHRDRQTVKHHLDKYQIVPIGGLVPKKHYGTIKKEEPVMVKTGKYDYLFDDLWDNRTLGA